MIESCEWDRRWLRLVIRDILWRFKPDTDAVEVGPAVNRIMRAISRRPLWLLAEEPVPGCVCWLCVLRLNAWAAQHAAIMRAERESAEEFD